MKHPSSMPGKILANANNKSNLFLRLTNLQHEIDKKESQLALFSDECQAAALEKNLLEKQQVQNKVWLVVSCHMFTTTSDCGSSSASSRVRRIRGRNREVRHVEE